MDFDNLPYASASIACPIGTDQARYSCRSETNRSVKVPNNKNVDVKRPGEKEEGKFHYNPGNMSGKQAGVRRDQPAQEKQGNDQSQSREDVEKRD